MIIPREPVGLYMAEDVKLSHVDEVLDDLAYPITNDEARAELQGITLQFADGAERLSDVIARSSMEVFVSPGDLEAELYSNLPVEAVGEPGQSEGEG